MGWVNQAMRQFSRLPRGGVDRNNPDTVRIAPGAVASLAEAWIETP